ncbi:alpha-amidating enzyme precursor 2, partial [Biomphalaria glabrata]
LLAYRTTPVSRGGGCTFCLASFLTDLSGLVVTPRQVYPVDISCTFRMDKSIFPFAYRTHSHGLGRVITGYQHNGSYHKIGKGNPQWPQAFYPVNDIIEVKPGDAL